MKAVHIVMVVLALTGVHGRMVLRRSLQENILFAESQQQALVDGHNSRRGNTSPPATDMKNMVWNATLEKYAMEWATCAHFATHRFELDAETMPAGENLATAYSSGDFDVDKQIEGAMGGWWGESNDYDYGANKCSKVCGHYTQMAWSATTSVGCAYALCEDVEFPPTGEVFPNGFYIVCNYYDQGNCNGNRPYSSAGEKGGACFLTERLFW